MKLRSLCLCLTASLLLGRPGFAAPTTDAKDSGPTLTIQVKPINDLIQRVKDTAKNFLPQMMYDEFEREVLRKLDPKELPGVDPKRPFGFYATLDASIVNMDFTKSHFVAMVPVTGEKDFLALIEKSPVKPTKKEDGLYSVSLPFVTVFLRFTNDYAYVSCSGTEPIEAKHLANPKEFFSEKETALAMISFRFDRLPNEVKGAVLGGFEQAMKIYDVLAAPEFIKEFMHSYAKLTTRFYKMLFEDGKEATYRIDLDSKSAAILIDSVIQAKPKSSLAEAFASFKIPDNRFAGLIGKDSAASVVMTLPLFTDELRTSFSKLAEDGGKMLVEEGKNHGAPPEALDLGDAFFKALAKTLASGKMDMAASFNGPDNLGLYQAVGAMQFKDAPSIEKALEKLIKIAPEKVQQVVKWNAEKIGTTSVHELDLSKEAPKEIKGIFGESFKLSFSFTEEGIFAAFGSDNSAALKQALNAKTVKVPYLQAEVSPKKFETLVKNLHGNIGVIESAILSKDKMTIFSVDVQGGGEKLTMKATYGAPMFMAVMGAWAFEARGKFAPVAQPVPAIKKD